MAFCFISLFFPVLLNLFSTHKLEQTFEITSLPAQKPYCGPLAYATKMSQPSKVPCVGYHLASAWFSNTITASLTIGATLLFLQHAHHIVLQGLKSPFCISGMFCLQGSAQHTSHLFLLCLKHSLSWGLSQISTGLHTCSPPLICFLLFFYHYILSINIY